MSEQQEPVTQDVPGVEADGVTSSKGDAPEVEVSEIADAATASDAGGTVSDGDSAEEADRDEGDIAADFIEELLDIADIDGDLEIDVHDGRTYLSVTAEGDSNLAPLSTPEVVDALQQVTRLAVQSELGDFSRLILDVGGSRDARRHELEALVARAAERIDEGAARAALPPMSSYERKIVHDLAAERGFGSESEGEGRDRHTVLTPQA